MLFLIRFLKFRYEVFDYKEETEYLKIEKRRSIFGEDMNSMPTFIETAFSRIYVHTFSKNFD